MRFPIVAAVALLVLGVLGWYAHNAKAVDSTYLAGG
jgi:hypothetical protein